MILKLTPAWVQNPCSYSPLRGFLDLQLYSAWHWHLSRSAPTRFIPHNFPHQWCPGSFLKSRWTFVSYQPTNGRAQAWVFRESCPVHRMSSLVKNHYNIWTLYSKRTLPSPIYAHYSPFLTVSHTNFLNWANPVSFQQHVPRPPSDQNSLCFMLAENDPFRLSAHPHTMINYK